jgi:hypothetical protein
MPGPGPSACESKPSPAGPAKAPEHDPIDDLKRHAAELWAYVRHLIAAKWNARVHSIKRIALAAVLTIVFLAAAGVALASAVVLALIGLTNGLTILVGGREWLAQISVGFGVLATIVGVLLIFRRAMLTRWKQITAAKFEGRAHEQRIRFQRDVVDAAGAYLRERIPPGTTSSGRVGPETNGHGDHP